MTLMVYMAIGYVIIGALQGILEVTSAMLLTLADTTLSRIAQIVMTLFSLGCIVGHVVITWFIVKVLLEVL